MNLTEIKKKDNPTPEAIAKMLENFKVENEKDPYKYLKRYSRNPSALYFGVNNLLEIN